MSRTNTRMFRVYREGKRTIRELNTQHVVGINDYTIQGQRGAAITVPAERESHTLLIPFDSVIARLQQVKEAAERNARTDQMIAWCLGGSTEDQLKTAFERVQDPADWKAAIDAEVPEAEVSHTVAAIEFYTGTEVQQLPATQPGMVRITSVGYRNGPCGP